MNQTAYTEMLGVIDDAIGLAGDAVKAADEARQAHKPEPVTLVKVASDRAYKAAVELMKTGAFSGQSATGLAKIIEKGDPVALLGLMEKLASRAVFSLDADEVLGGNLVEKSDAARIKSEPGTPTSRTQIWDEAMVEAGLG